MVKVIYTFSILTLISALALFVFCGFQWMDYEPWSESGPNLSIIEKLKQNDNHNKNNEPTLSPLIKQAQAFALYLNPPEPPKPKKASVSKSETVPVAKTVTLPKIEPKFTLLSTSCYRSNPRKSLALVSEPGKGRHWVKAGENIGHFKVEEVTKGMIIFRQDDHLHQMAINANTPVIDTAESSETALALNKDKDDKKTQQRTSPHKPSTKTPKPFYKLGPRRSKTVAFEHDKIGSS
jgi:hypothetical protein